MFEFWCFDTKHKRKLSTGWFTNLLDWIWNQSGQRSWHHLLHFNRGRHYLFFTSAARTIKTCPKAGLQTEKGIFQGIYLEWSTLTMTGSSTVSIGSVKVENLSLIWKIYQLNNTKTALLILYLTYID